MLSKKSSSVQLLDSEFQKINVEDNDKILQFYEKYKLELTKDYSANEEDWYTILSMKSEIIQAGHSLKDNVLIDTLEKKSITEFRLFAKSYPHNLTEDISYISLLFNRGISNFNANRFWKARKDFSELASFRVESKYDDFLKECNNKLKLSFANAIGILGLIVIVLKEFSYRVLELESSLLPYFGILGGLLLITYGVMTTFLIKPVRS